MQLKELKEFRNHVRAEENPTKKNDRDLGVQRSREGPKNPKFNNTPSQHRPRPYLRGSP